MAKKYDLSDLGGAIAYNPEDLGDIGGEKITTPSEEVGGMADMLKGVLKGGMSAAKGAGKYGAGLLSGSAEEINKELMDIPGMKKLMPQLAQEKLFGKPFQQLERSGAFQAGEAGGRPIGTAINLSAMDLPFGMAAKSLKALPVMEKLAPEIKAAIRPLAGTASMASYGGLTTPYDRMGGLEKGALYGTMAELMPGVLPAARKGMGLIAPKLGPKAHAENMLNELSGGKSVNEATRSLASDIDKMQSYVKDQSTKNYKEVFDKHGDSNIYQKDIPKDGYLGLDSKITEDFPKHIKDEESRFLKNPTFENAHKYQSILGNAESTLRRKANKDLTETNLMKNIGDSRKAVNNDIYSFLGEADKTGPERPFTDTAGYKYAAAGKYHKDNVIPYRDSKLMKEISEGTKVNPRNIQGLFKNPEDNTWKILSHLGQGAQDKILYSQLGKQGVKRTPEGILNAANKLDEQGLGSYISPNLEQQLQSLHHKVKLRNIAERGGGAALGALALSPVGAHMMLPYAGEAGGIAGAGLGALFGPRLFKKALTRVPEEIGTKKAVSNEAFKRLMTRALAANLVRGDQ